MTLTKHAALRTRQRGIRIQTVEMICRFADRESFVGSGAVHIFVSRAMVRRLIEQGHDPRDLRQLYSTSLVLDPDCDTVITCIRGSRSTRGIKRYRRGQHTRH